MPRLRSLRPLLALPVLLAPILPAAAMAAKAPVATTPGAWTKLSDRPGSPTDAPALTRDSTGSLHLLYTARATAESVALRSRTLTPLGGWNTPLTLVTGWRSISAPDAVSFGADTFAFWAGLQALGTTQSTPGTAWAAQLEKTKWTRLLDPSSASAGPADASTLSATIDTTGTPWFAWSTSDTLGIHQGFAASAAETLTPIECCELGTNLESDRRSGEMFAIARASTSTTAGITMRRVRPSAAAPITLIESGFDGRSVARATRIPTAARTTEGVFAAYCASVPRCTKIRVTNQQQRSLSITPKLAVRPESIALSAGPEGRLWLSWTDVQRNVWSTRSNRAATRWGTPARIAGPKGMTSAWHAAAEGSAGPLDVVLNASTSAAPGGPTFLWYSRLRPALTLAPVPTVYRNGGMKVVRVHVSDAGDKVRSIVTFRGAKRRTNGDGAATLIIPPDTAPGRYPLTATTTGYTSAAGTLVIR